MRILFFLIALSFASCTDLGSTDTYTYTIINDSGVSVKIVGYVTTNVEHIIALNNSETHTQVYKDGLPPRGYHFRYLFGSPNGNYDADSIKIVYDNIKFKKFGINNLSDIRNPLGPNHNNGELEATYTISQEDYENAEDCNDNCE